MKNHKILFEKIEAKKKEWDAQVKSLQSKAVGFDSETRVKIEKQINNLNMKFKEIEKRTDELKKISKEAQHDLGDKILASWNELSTKIDNAMLKLKK